MNALIPRTLARQRITAALKAAVSTHPLVVLTAPMGYGKTTAARELIAALRQRVFYVAVTPGPHNALYLWDMAFSQLASQGSEIAQILRNMGFPAETMRLQRTFDQGRAYLASRPTLLVVDDYHYVTDPRMDALLEALAREVMPGFCILLLSRSRPNMQLEDMRIKGLAALFDQRLLTFSRQEGVDYFTMHGQTDIALAEQAWEYCEGWAAALWLSLQSCHTHGTVTPINNLESLLAETVFTAYDAADQAFLLQLSILDSFTTRQATMICNNPEAPRRLRDLHSRNAFLSYDPPSERYQLHSIFRAFLAKRLAELPPAKNSALPAARPEDIHKPSLYRQAGEWCAAAQDPVGGMRFFFRAGRDEDLLRILELFAVPGDGLFVMFDPEGVFAMLTAIPWRVRRRCPVGWLAFIYHYMSRVNLEKGLAMLKEASACFAGDEELGQEEKRRIAGEIELIHGIDAFNDLFAMRDRHARAYELLQGRSGISHSRLIWTFGSPHAAFLYLREPGSYERLVRLVEDNLYQYQELTGGCSAGGQDLFRAELLLETGGLSQVEPLLMKAAYKAAAKEQLASLIAAHFSLARLRLAQGNPKEARAALHEIAPQVERSGNPLLGGSFDLCVGYLAGIVEKNEDVPSWLRRGYTTAGRSFYQGTGFALVAHGRALLADKNWACLEALAEDMPARLGPYRNLFGRIHAGVLRGIALLHLRGVEKALAALREAVELARPDGITLAIAEYGAHILPLLQRLCEFAPGDTFMRGLRATAKPYALRFSAATGNTGLLAPQERAVMEKAARELTSTAIAQELGLAPKTVRNTLSRIYAKLNVKTRAQAVRKWRGDRT